MANKLSALCPHCGKEGTWSQGEVDGIDEIIADERSDAAADVRSEYDDDELVHPSALAGGDRPLWELAAAVRRGDRNDAEYWLDRLAREIGAAAEDEVQLGRFSPKACHP